MAHHSFISGLEVNGQDVTPVLLSEAAILSNGVVAAAVAATSARVLVVLRIGAPSW
jgi:hypothetical protein